MIKVKFIADTDEGWSDYAGAFEQYARQLAQSAAGRVVMRAVQVDNITAIFKATAHEVYVIIQVGSSNGFLFRPHESKESYPLNLDNGTRSIASSDGSWTYDAAPEATEYGNIDWRNAETILTWKGPPSRYFPLDPSVTIEGLTFEDAAVIDGTSKTVFGAHVYQAGTIIATVPAVGSVTPKLLGAAYHGTTGKIVAVIATSYLHMTAPDGKTGGVFFEAWELGDNQQRITAVRAAHPTVAWFFNSLGTRAITVESGEVWRLSLDYADGWTGAFSRTSAVIEDGTQTAAVTSKEVSTSNKTMKGDTSLPDSGVTFNSQGIAQRAFPDRTWYADDWDGLETSGGNTVIRSINRNGGSRIVAADYKNDTEVFATIRNDGSTDSITHSALTFAKFDMVPWIPYDRPNLGVYGPITSTVGSRYVASGGCGGGYLFSFSGGTISQEGVITGLNACGTRNSSALRSVSVTDIVSGQTASFTVKLPGGTWGNQSTLFSGASCGGTPVSDLDVEVGYGLVRYAYCVQFNNATTGGGSDCAWGQQSVPNYPQGSKAYPAYPVWCAAIFQYSWVCP